MADTKISALTADTAPSGDDLIVTVNDPAGTPANRKVALADLTNKALVTAAYGSLPAAGWTGRLLLPSDGAGAIIRDNGTDLYDTWGPILPFKDPQKQSWAWINQGSATVTTSKGGIFLYDATNTTSFQDRIRKKAAPATPYTVTAALLPLLPFNDDNINFTTFTPLAGLCFRESSSGKLVVFNYYYATDAITSNVTMDCHMAISKHSSPSAFSADYVHGWPTSATRMGPCPILRIADDGANLKFSFSVDGQNFLQIYSVGRANYMTVGPDEVGFFVNENANNSGVAPNPVGVTVLSWVEG